MTVARFDTGGADRLIGRALGRVLDIDPSVLRADTPLDALGLDSLARVCLADALESPRPGEPAVLVDDDALSAARAVGDVARALTVRRGAP